MDIIVGSAALAEYNFSPRKAKDLDQWFDGSTWFENKADNHYIPTEILKLVPCKRGNYATPDAIYTIKCSHAAWDIHWNKTMSDIVWLKDKGCKLIPELYWKLYEYWKTVHGDKSFLSLDKTKKDFFDDYVPHSYEHDLLHEIVAKPNKPAYTTILKRGQEVLTDKEQFFKLTKEQQIKVFKEEICVIALERILIPKDFKFNKYSAYRFALKKTITNLTKNWATLFILDNYKDFIRMENSNWYNNFLTHIGKEVIMHPIIAKVKEEANKLNISEGHLTEMLFHGDLYTEVLDEASEYYRRYPEYLEDAKNAVKFSEFLASMGFKHITQEGGEGLGDSAVSVIELEGQMFRADYSYASYDGYYIDDYFDWQPVEAKTKTIVVYE